MSISRIRSRYLFQHGAAATRRAVTVVNAASTLGVRVIGCLLLEQTTRAAPADTAVTRFDARCGTLWRRIAHEALYLFRASTGGWEGAGLLPWERRACPFFFFFFAVVVADVGADDNGVGVVAFVGRCYSSSYFYTARYDPTLIVSKLSPTMWVQLR